MDYSFKNLDLNNFFYDYVLRVKILAAKDQLSAHELMQRISCLARFAWRNHPGYFSDGRLENILVKFGENLEQSIDPHITKKFPGGLAPDQDTRYSVIHVATKLFEVGGHTRVLYQWMKRNNAKHQLVLLTGQSLQDVPHWFREGLENIEIVSLHAIHSLFDRAYLLRVLAARSNCVVLHHHPDDVVPLLAFSADCSTPVLLLDHAHSWFWLGASVIDKVLSPSLFHEQFARAKRPIRNVSYFPFTQLGDLELGFGPNDKREIKKQLGMNPDRTCLMTIGTLEKFIPNDQYNFYRTARKIMRRFDDVDLYVIGISENEELRNKYQLDAERVHLLGYIDDPTAYYKAADICLDALPQPSLGGTIYAALIGLACPLFKYGNSHVFNGMNLFTAALYRQHVGAVHSEQQYLEKLAFLIANPAIRISIASEIRAEYSAVSSKERLAATIKEALRDAQELRHQPHAIPDGFYFRDADSAEIADAGCCTAINDRMMPFDAYLGIRDKLAILAGLLLKPACVGAVLSFAGQALLRKVKARISSRGFSRRLYGTRDCIVSAPVSPHSGK